MSPPAQQVGFTVWNDFFSSFYDPPARKQAVFFRTHHQCRCQAFSHFVSIYVAWHRCFDFYVVNTQFSRLVYVIRNMIHCDRHRQEALSQPQVLFSDPIHDHRKHHVGASDCRGIPDSGRNVEDCLFYLIRNRTHRLGDDSSAERAAEQPDTVKSECIYYLACPQAIIISGRRKAVLRTLAGMSDNICRVNMKILE